MVLPMLAAAGIQAAPGIIGMFQKTKKTPQERAAEAAMAQAQEYIDISMNPDDPRFKKMVESESQGIRGGFLEQLRDTVEANRRQALLGRQQFFDPERRDETTFSAVNRAGRDAQLQARSNVLDRLNNAVMRLQGQQSGYNNLANLEMGRRNQKRQTNLAGLGALGQGANDYFNKPRIPASLGVA